MKISELRLQPSHRFRAKLTRLVSPVLKGLPPGSIEFNAEFSTDQEGKPINWSSLLPHFSAADVEYADVVELFDISLSRRVDVLTPRRENRQREINVDEIVAAARRKGIDLVEMFYAAREGNIARIRSIMQEVPGVAFIYDQHGNTALNIASYFGHVEIVDFILQNDGGELINFKNEGGYSPLYSAAQMGRLITVDRLLAKGADVNAGNRIGSTPLHAAAENGHEEVVLALIKNGALVSIKATDGAEPLYLAAQNGYVKIVEILLDRGAEVDASTRKNATPLLIAAAKGHASVVELLIRRGANVNARTSDGYTPLKGALEQGKHKVANILREHGALV